MARVLVVDDEPGLRSFLAEALEMADHEVTEAEDGEAALARLRKDAFHVVVTDLKMPRLDGLGLLKAIKAEQPELEVILLTAHGAVDSAVEAMKQGAFDYLQKPLDSPKELRLVVERALERRGLRDQAEAARSAGVTLTWGDPAMRPVVNALEKVAPTDATVLLTGESGTGKEVAARALHNMSKRADGPFVAVNCAVLSDTLLESELFGHEKGAFTGADARRRGKLELAEDGTFFLDEVGELKPELQAKLLRALQEKQFERVGGNQTLSVNARFVAATNRDLAHMVSEGTFREDLFHRLNVFPVNLPALRERPGDVGPLAETLLKQVSADLGQPGARFTEAALGEIARREWKGNVRELRNAIERACILAGGADIDVGALSPAAQAKGPALSGAPTMAEAEKAAIEAALRLHEGNRKKAAEHLGIGERTLYDKLKKHGLR
jgi:two-component system response regulator FlrC